MNIKSIVLIALGLICAFYVVYLQIHYHIEVKKSECGASSCVRFCTGSNLKLNLEAVYEFENLSKSYIPMVNEFCEENHDFDDEESNTTYIWKFLPVISKIKFLHN
jgi:hypothetical protein